MYKGLRRPRTLKKTGLSSPAKGFSKCFNILRNMIRYPSFVWWNQWKGKTVGYFWVGNLRKSQKSHFFRHTAVWKAYFFFKTSKFCFPLFHSYSSRFKLIFSLFGPLGSKLSITIGETAHFLNHRFSCTFLESRAKYPVFEVHAFLEETRHGL